MFKTVCYYFRLFNGMLENVRLLVICWTFPKGPFCESIGLVASRRNPSGSHRLLEAQTRKDFSADAFSVFWKPSSGSLRLLEPEYKEVLSVNVSRKIMVGKPWDSITIIAKNHCLWSTRRFHIFYKIFWYFCGFNYSKNAN